MIILIDEEYLFGKICSKYVRHIESNTNLKRKTMWVHFDSSKKPIPLRYEETLTDRATSFVTEHFQIDYNSYDPVERIKKSIFNFNSGNYNDH